MSQLWSSENGEPDMAYLYRHQLDEADVIAINKADLLAEDEIDLVIAHINRRFPSTQVITCSAVTGNGLDGLLREWATERRNVLSTGPSPSTTIVMAQLRPS